MTTNMQTAATIVAKLGNLLIKFSHAGTGYNGGLALHYDTFTDEQDEFGTPLHFVEVFTDDHSYILHHVNLINNSSEKKVTQFFFDTTNAINAQAAFYADKIKRDAQPSDDSELSIVTTVDDDDDELVDPPVDFTKKIDADLLIYRDGRLAEVESLKYGAWIEFHPDGVHYFTKPVALNGNGFDCDADRWDFDDFISILAQRGAVNEFVSTPKETFQDKLAALKADYISAKAIFDEKQARLAEAKKAASQACDVYEDSKRAIESFYQEQRAALKDKLDSVLHGPKIRIMHNNEFFCSSPALNLTVSGGSDNTNYQFSFINWHDIFKPCATYDTPEQVVKVIGMLKAAIQRGDNEFTFPPVDELNFNANENEISSEEVNQTPPDIGDSLIRAMETALKRIQDICRTKPTNLTSINREWQCYLICRRAIGGITNVSAD